MKISQGKITRAQKCAIYGCEGIGKSTFATQFPKPLFADLEKGTGHLDVTRLESIDQWAALLSTVDELIKDPQGFETFVIDTADWAERMCATALCEKYKKSGIEEFGYGKGYAYLSEEFAKLLAKLTELQESGMHVVLLAHSTIRKLELPEEVGSYDHYELKCSKGVTPLIKEWTDGVLFINYRTIVQTGTSGRGKGIGGKERVLYTAHTAFCDAKNRWNLPDVLPLDFKQLERIFVSASAPVFAEVPAPVPQPKEKTPLEQLETLMELTAVNAQELNDYLRGRNAKKRAYITPEQTYENLPSAMLLQLIAPNAWERVERQITEGRAE